MGYVVSCCVALSRRCAFPFPSRRRVADPFRLYFGPPFCLFQESLTSLCVHCPSQEFGGLRQLPLPETSRRLTRLFHTWFGYWPNPTCRSVGKMYTSRVLVLNLVPHTPFLYSYLLMLFSRDYGGRETMFENSNDPFLVRTTTYW